MPTDIWLHIKDAPGCHVIIRTGGAKVPDETLLFAAQICAERSGAGAGAPIDWTLRKFVKKPSGAKPGQVIYDHQKTIYV